MVRCSITEQQKTIRIHLHNLRISLKKTCTWNLEYAKIRPGNMEKEKTLRGLTAIRVRPDRPTASSMTRFSASMRFDDELPKTQPPSMGSSLASCCSRRCVALDTFSCVAPNFRLVLEVRMSASWTTVSSPSCTSWREDRARTHNYLQENVEAPVPGTWPQRYLQPGFTIEIDNG